MSGAVGGGQIGCNYQWSNWVVGVEVDGSVTQSDGQSTFILAPIGRFQNTEHWMATARGKLGYASDKWLVYVTGGGAWAELQTTAYNAFFLPAGVGFGGAAIQKNTLNGWTVGLGAEYALGYGWSIKGEYLYMDFSEKGYFSPSTPAVAGEERLHLRQSVARFGMNYKFDWGGPVVARY
jgi:outer membrane immunogenic protein